MKDKNLINSKILILSKRCNFIYCAKAGTLSKDGKVAFRSAFPERIIDYLEGFADACAMYQKHIKQVMDNTLKEKSSG